MHNNIQSRTWGTRFDSFISAPSPTLNPTISCENDAFPADQNNVQGRKQPGRMPHDSSVFVGSLPCNVEHNELTRLLSEHLSDQTEVQNIKVVRDSKGGTCAFIQCQDAASAARLIDKLHILPQRQFMGRYLRYEPARAFRTLLISYRTPRQYTPPDVVVRPLRDSKPGYLELPSAMRLWRNAGAKYLSILYNSDACTTAEVEGLQANTNCTTDAPNLLLFPLLFNAETLQKIVALFGHVEYFAPHIPPKANSAQDTGNMSDARYIYPHDTTRSAVMDPGCWEVKWCYRDDCVSALMTLRKVPHLTVTWAHQLPPVGHQSPQNTSRQHVSPIKSNVSSHSIRTQVGTNDAHTNHLGETLLSELRLSRFSEEGNRVHETNGTTPTSAGRYIVPRSSSISDDREWTRTVVSVAGTRVRARARAHSMSYRSGSSLTTGEDDNQFSDQPLAGWSGGDVPPLGDAPKGARGKMWGDRMISKEGEDRNDSMPIVASPSKTLPLFDTPCVPESQISFEEEGDEGQDIDDIPPTPEFGTSPITPRTPGSLMPHTPTTGSYMGDFRSIYSKEYNGKGISTFPEAKRQSVLDPTTIFVGGLEMYGPNAWDEQSVRAFFTRYGGVETVKFVRPVNKRSAFAFVKFDNTESPARAVNEEHNRILDGRPIRVQLRDWNPPHRTIWKFARRGRNQQFGATHHHIVHTEDTSEEISANPSFLSLTLEDKIVGVDVDSFTDKDTSIEIKNEPESTVTKWTNDVQTVEGKSPCQLSPTEPAGGKGPVSDLSALPQSSTSQAEDQDKACMDEASAPASIAPPSFYPSTSVPTPPVAYPIHTVGCYPQGWMPGFAPQMSYPVPFAYPGGYAYPHYPNPPGSDASGPQSGTQSPFAPAGPMYAPLIPYPAYPMRPFGIEQTRSQAAGTPQPQAPLLPTGFIHGDQGMLVPVYQPDALDQYMSGVQSQQAATNKPPAAMQSAPTWRPYTQPPAFPQAIQAANIYGMHTHPFQAIPGSQLSSGSQGWVPHHATPTGAPETPRPSVDTSRQYIQPPFTAGAPNPGPTGFEQRPVPPRRQYRRISQSDNNKNNNRGSPNRYSRGNMTPSYSGASHHSLGPHRYNVPSHRDSGGGNDWTPTQWSLSQ